MGNWVESSTELIEDGAQAKMVKGHIVNAEFYKSYFVPEGINPGNYSIKGKLIYRACDNKLCTVPQNLPFVSWVQVGEIK
jgi:hypothetical protein